MGSNQESNWPLIFRQRAWFRPHVALDDLPPFPTNRIDKVQARASNTWEVKTLMGRGPVMYELPMMYHAYFGHGEEPYPSFVCPSCGPMGAGLFGKAIPREISIGQDSALFLIEIVLVQAAPPNWAETYDAEMATCAKSGCPPQGPTSNMVSEYLSLSRQYLDTIVGVYALYQHPLVWELLGRSHNILHVDLQSRKLKAKSPIEFDNFVPFLLRPHDKIVSGMLSDAVTKNCSQIFQLDLHLPLLLLQQTLWQRDLRLRFITQVWIMERLAQKHSREIAGDAEITSFVNKLEEVVKEQFPQHADYFRKKKGSLLNPNIADLVIRYCEELGIASDESIAQRATIVQNKVSRGVGAKGDRAASLEWVIRRTITVRNKLSHGVEVQREEVADLELMVRELTRHMIQKEIEAAGVELRESNEVPDAAGGQGKDC